MKQLKRHIVSFVFMVVVVVSSLFLVVFNIAMEHYIDQEAKTALTEIYGGQSLFSANLLYLNYDIQILNYVLSQDEQLLYEYFSTQEISNNDVQVIELEGNTYYVERFNDYYTYGGLTYSTDPNNSYNVEVLYPTLAYVNVTAVKTIVERVNYLFAGVLIISGVLAVFLGFKLGSKVEDSENRLKHFFQNVSHELKTPLMSIQGYAEGLQTGIIKDVPLVSEVILRHSDEMNELIQELLALSKLDTGNYAMSKERIAMEKLLYECLLSVESIAEQSKIQFKVTWPGREMDVIGDPAYLKKAINTIIANGIRYANHTVCIGLYEHHGKVELSIKDDGLGIDENDLPHIFERFYSGKNGNTGIGLAMAQEIIKYHKGNIVVKNSNKGSEFIIQLKEAKGVVS